MRHKSGKPDLCDKSGHDGGDAYVASLHRHARDEPLCRHARDEPLIRHARLYAGHPRLNDLALPKTWMAGTSPAMTKEGFSLAMTN